MRVLVACEFSGTVREAFRAMGHTAHSCDILPAEDGSRWHHQCDVRRRMSDVIQHKEIGFELNAPCADCPFRRSTEFHEGVMKSLPEYVTKMESGEFSHSCHKTDPRSDSEGAKPVNGRIQHCVGAILMCEKSGNGQMPYLTAFVKGDLNIDELEDPGDIMGPKEMVKRYLRWLCDKMRREGKDPSLSPALANWMAMDDSGLKK